MQPNIIERVWRQDKMVNVDVLNGFTFTDEEEAHRFIISGKNVNTPVVISGTITANFKNAEGVLVPLTGTIEDGKAVVVLSQECYAVEGPFSLMIFADTVCIYAAIANVINSSGEVIAYPTAAIPDVHELIVEAQEIVHRLDNGYNSYPTLTVGPADVLTVTDGADDIPLKTLSVAIEPKQDLHGYDKPWIGGAGKNKLIDSGYVQGVLGWNETTADNIVANYNFITSPYMPINNDTAYTLSAIHGNIVRIYVTDENHNKLYFRGNGPVEGNNAVIPATSGAVYLRVSIGIDAETVIPSDYGTKVYGQLELGSAATSYEPYSNICPITGWDEATMTRTGKNLLNPNAYASGYISANGSFISDAGYKASDFIRVTPGDVYTFSLTYTITGSGSIKRVHGYDKNKNWVLQLGEYGVSHSGNYSYQITIPNGITYVRVSLADISNDTNTMFGLSPSSYEPPECQTLSVNLSSVAGGTVYGGTLTINEDGTGTLVVDGYKLDLGSLTWNYESEYLRFYCNNLPNNIAHGEQKETSRTSYCISDSYECLINGEPYNNNWNGVLYFGSYLRIYVHDHNYTDATALKTALSGKYVVYPITPTTYSLTATQLSTLLGNNTVWCDAGQVSMTYRADTKLYIDRKLAELAANIVNS